MKNLTNPKFLLLFSICFFAWTIETEAQKSDQNFTVQGSVKDSKGEIIKGAILLIKGSSSGTVTDLEGNYMIKVPSENAVLVCSFIGFESKEVEVNGKKKLNIVLDQESKDEKAPDYAQNFLTLDRVDQKPRPATGENGWNYYLSRNIKYPLSARQNKIEGTVILSLEIDPSGEIKNVDVLRGVGKELDEEAIRVVSAGPNWTPGMINGEAVQTRVSLPIRFVINDDSFENSLAQKKEKAIADQYKDYVVVVGYLPSN